MLVLVLYVKRRATVITETSALRNSNNSSCNFSGAIFILSWEITHTHAQKKVEMLTCKEKRVINLELNSSQNKQANKYPQWHKTKTAKPLSQTNLTHILFYHMLWNIVFIISWVQNSSLLPFILSDLESRNLKYFIYFCKSQESYQYLCLEGRAVSEWGAEEANMFLFHMHSGSLQGTLGDFSMKFLTLSQPFQRLSSVAEWGIIKCVFTLGRRDKGY